MYGQGIEEQDIALLQKGGSNLQGAASDLLDHGQDVGLVILRDIVRERMIFQLDAL